MRSTSDSAVLCRGTLDAQPDRRSVVDATLDCGSDSAVSGRIFTSSGRPAAHLNLALEPTDDEGSSRTISTDESGRFRTAIDTPGEYQVTGFAAARYLFGPLWKGNLTGGDELVITLPEDFVELTKVSAEPPRTRR